MYEHARNTETIDWHKNSKELIEEFFDTQIVTMGYNSPNDKKKNFPRLNNHLIDMAITMDFLDYSMKDKILKDPNKLSIFFVQIDSQSPFTKQALSELNFSSEVCQTHSFQDFYKYDQDPLKALINYMMYLSNQYKHLQKLLHRRNQLKKNQILKDRKQQKRFMQTFHETSSLVYAEADTFLTLIPKQNSIAIQPVSQTNKSFRHNRSLDSLCLSFDDKLSKQKLKSLQLQNTYQKYIDSIDQEELKLEEDNEKKKSIYDQRNRRIQEIRQKYVQ